VKAVPRFWRGFFAFKAVKFIKLNGGSGNIFLLTSVELGYRIDV